jgi:peptidoglycan hydrolase-like protein with peptidoglycan-binding domain
MRFRTSITAGLVLLLTAGTVWCATPKAASKPASKGTPRPGKSTHSSAQPASAASKSRVKKSGKRSKRRERGQTAPAPERISEIQQALAKDGSFAGAPSGKWDDSTVEAMKKFQAGHGLSPTGKLDALSLQKLGLGSQTAGVAAPMPPIANSSIADKAAQSAQRQ